MPEKTANSRQQTANSYASPQVIKDLLVTVTMNLLELKLYRRALAKAADDGVLDRTYALNQICALDVLRWEAEEQAAKPTVRRESRMRRVA